MPLTAGKVHAAQIAWLQPRSMCLGGMGLQPGDLRSEEHTSELQSQSNLVCRLLLEKKTMFSAAYAGSRCGVPIRVQPWVWSCSVRHTSSSYCSWFAFACVVADCAIPTVA